MAEEEANTPGGASTGSGSFIGAGGVRTEYSKEYGIDIHPSKTTVPRSRTVGDLEHLAASEAHKPWPRNATSQRWDLRFTAPLASFTSSKTPVPTPESDFSIDDLPSGDEASVAAGVPATDRSVGSDKALGGHGHGSNGSFGSLPALGPFLTASMAGGVTSTPTMRLGSLKSASGTSFDHTAVEPLVSGKAAGGGHGGAGVSGVSRAFGPATAISTMQAAVRREGKVVLAMVGLPARGKTYMARRLKRHLTWIGYKTEIFNVGNYRRKILGAMQTAEFFDPRNAEAEEARREVSRVAFADMIEQLRSDVVDIAIFDATNTTRERRKLLAEAIVEAEATLGTRIQLVFIESICNDETVIKLNIQETKAKMPDYKDMAETTAVADFLQRIEMYQSAYQTIDAETEGEYRYIKLIDVGRQLIANRIQGFLNSRVMFFLSNLHITPREILLTRHGESQYNVQGLIGGDSLLSPRGEAYSLKLAAFVQSRYPPDTELPVWTSTLRRTQQTAGPTGREIVTWKALDEIDAGVCDGMTYEAIAAKMPEEYAARVSNKFSYRYPRGESYQDIVHRLEPVIIELMRQQTPVLIVSHQATLRVLYAYLTDRPPESCPDALVPLHTVIQLTPRAYGCDEVRHELM